MALKCPHCPDQRALSQAAGKGGILIDICDQCLGIWFDQGEVLHYSKAPEKLEKSLQQPLLQEQKSQGPNCPRCHLPMNVGGLLDEKLQVDRCEECGGMWFDQGEVQALQQLEQTKGWATLESKPHRRTQEASNDSPMVFPMFLPSLWIRSLVTMTLLYSVLAFAILILADLGELPPAMGTFVAIVFIFINFLISPFILDLMIKWAFSGKFVTKKELPPHLVTFVERVSAERKIKFPSFAIINDGAPNAFTYGHTPDNARIVLTRGLFEICNEQEVEAVTAHEIGHIVHWDMLVMTMASVIPILTYYIYRTMAESTKRSPGKKKDVRPLIMIISYVLYIISEYLVLYLSRIREYYADRFSGEVTKNPSALASALIKIAYGLAQENHETEKTLKKRSLGRGDRPVARTESGSGFSKAASIRSLGIFDPKSSKALVAGAMGGVSDSEEVDPEQLLDPMQWDLWNPWGTYYELHSTHPLPAKRIQALAQQSIAMNQKPYALFDRQKPESYWDEFLVDLLITALPFLGILVGIVFFTSQGHISARHVDPIAFFTSVGLGLLVMGFFYSIYNQFRYKKSDFPFFSVAALLKKVKVSKVRPIPATIKGKIIGRGVPGLIWSEDMVLRDKTGFIFMDYQQPLGLWNAYFGLFKSGTYQGKEVVAEGWYRRSPVPYFEVKQFRLIEKQKWTTCYSPILSQLTPYFLMLLGIFLIIYPRMS